MCFIAVRISRRGLCVFAKGFLLRHKDGKLAVFRPGIRIMLGSSIEQD